MGFGVVLCPRCCSSVLSVIDFQNWIDHPRCPPSLQESWLPTSVTNGRPVSVPVLSDQELCSCSECVAQLTLALITLPDSFLTLT